MKTLSKYLVFVTTLVFSLCASATTLFSDKFDTYPAGAFPPAESGWTLRYNGAGPGQQYVDTFRFVSKPQSLRLMGASCWAAAAYHPVTLPTLPNTVITVTAKVYSGPVVSGGCSQGRGGYGLSNPSAGTWGTDYGSISFSEDKYIYVIKNHYNPSDSVKLMEYVPDKWYTIQSSLDVATKTMKVYINGILRAKDIKIDDLETSFPTGLNLGAGHGEGPTMWFDDVSVTSTSYAPPPSGLVGWWQGEGQAMDSMGYSDGTAMNGVGYPQGKVGRAFSFNGVDRYVAIPDKDLWTLGDKPFTIDLWVKFSKLPSAPVAPFVGHDEGGGEQNKWLFGYDSYNGPALSFHINSRNANPFGPIYTIRHPWNPLVGRWYHVAVTRNGGNYALYLNGNRVATSNNQNYTLQNAEAPLTLGKAEDFYFNGTLDEVDIYDRALTATEIRSIYLAGAQGKRPPAIPPLGGSLFGLVPTGGTATCENLTTGESKVITIPKQVRTWDCTSSGLVIKTGDQVKVTATLSGSTP